MGIVSKSGFRPGSPQHERFARLSLVVADSQDFFLHQTRRTLTQIGIRDIHLAQDGAEALGLVRTEQPHLAIVDWDMDAIPGLEFAAFLRRAEGSPNPRLPVIMTMASADKSKISKAMSAGVNEILIKPVTGDVLMRRIVSSIAAQYRPKVQTASYMGPERRTADQPIAEERRAAQ